MSINKTITSQGGGGGINKDIIPAVPGEINKSTDSTRTPKVASVKEIVDVNGGSVTPTPTPTPDEGDIGSKYPEEWLPDVDEYIPGQTDASQQAKDQADLQFVTDMESVKSSQLAATQNVNKNASSATQDYTMLEYANNQTIEKMGWTGGSYTDLKSMEQYIKATIAADMYGQVELLKYGYKTELAKAVAAKEANLASLEYQYMQQAFQNNLTLSQQSGVWIHPLIENDLAQLDIAESIMKEMEAKGETKWTSKDRANYDRAKSIYGKINEWYLNSKTPLSQKGIDALKEYFKEQNYYNDVTLTSEQIRDLQINSVNAERLANQSYAAKEFESGRVVDAQGNLIVDLNSNNFEAISQYFEENPGQWKEWVLNKYEVPIQSAFAKFKENNPTTDITTIQGFLAQNTQLLDEVAEYAEAAGMDKFTIGNMVYDVKDGKASPRTGKTIIPDDVPRTLTPEEADLDVETMKPGDEVDVDEYTYVVGDDNKLVLKEEVPVSFESYYDNFKDDMKENFGNNDIEFSTTKTGMSFTTSNNDDFRTFIGSFADGDGTKGQQVTYADAIISAANNNLITNGSLVKFNYGDTDSNAGYAIYHGGKFYKLTLTLDGTVRNGTVGPLNIWLPNGYKVSNSGKVTKK